MILKENDDLQNLAIFVIHKKGYKLIVEIDKNTNNVSYIVATKNEDSFYGDSFVSLLGLIELGETRNEEWQLSKEEMEYVLSIEDKLYD